MNTNDSMTACVTRAAATGAPHMSPRLIDHPEAARTSESADRTFGWAWERWRIHRITGSRPFALSTIEDYDCAYRRYIGPFFADILLDDITAETVDTFQVEMHRQGVSPVRYGKLVVPIRACLRWHRRTGAFTRDMTFWFDAPAPAADERRVISFEQAERLIAEMPEYYRPLISCSVYTGMRFGEIRALSWTDVDLDSGIIHVRRAMDRNVVRMYTKTKGSRSVGIPAHLVDALKEWSDLCPSSALNLVFPLPCGSPIDGSSFAKRYFKPALERAGIDRAFRIHDLRHTAASWYVRAGASVVDLMGAFGWSQLQTALRYVHRYETPVGLAEKLTASRDDQLSA